jgi:hypothetical protein
MNLNTIETGRKRTIACIGTFLIGLGLYMETQGMVAIVVGVIITGIYAIDRILEERE